MGEDEVNPQALTALGGLAILGKVAYGITADDGIPIISVPSTAPTLFHEPLTDGAERQGSALFS